MSTNNGNDHKHEENDEDQNGWTVIDGTRYENTLLTFFGKGS